MEETDRRQIVQAEGLLMVYLFFWAANYPVSKYGIGGDEQLVPIQFIGAAVTIAGVWYARRR